jgi:hypothetical protein
MNNSNVITASGGVSGPFFLTLDVTIPTVAYAFRQLPRARACLPQHVAAECSAAPLSRWLKQVLHEWVADAIIEHCHEGVGGWRHQCDGSQQAEALTAGARPAELEALAAMI